MFLMDSSHFEGAVFKSDVCQIVSVEHFFYGMKSNMADKKIKLFLIVSLSTLYEALFAGVIKYI